MRLRISRRALRDLDQIYFYWAKRAGVAIADRLLDAIEERLALLAEFPNSGRKCDALARGVRSFPAGKHLIYYRKARNTIEVLHVFHGARDQQGLSGERRRVDDSELAPLRGVAG